ncbi:MAG: polymer-forming cytoskeletal protein, partial [Rhodoferax sp.]|nr:polymer-forming cytoskeletal protein [Rhodoferax sp.]
MFSKKKQPPIKSLIAEGCRITGNIAFSDGLRIDGEVHGDIRADDADNSLLVISETATINGTVTAQHIIINGQVTGPVHAHRILELEPQARIDGDVEYLALEMHQGALIRGQLHPLLESGQKPALLLATDNTNSPKSAKSANNINNTHNT